MSCVKILVFLYFIVLCALEASVVNAAEWIAFGDLRGYVEPCGCSEQSNLGGLSRLSNYIEKARKDRKNVMVFDLGGHSGEKGANHVIYKALEKIRPDIVLDRDGKAYGRVQLSSNFKNKKIYRDGSTVFVGLLGDRPIVEETLKQQTQGSTERVLLYHGSDEVLKKILNMNIFTTVVTSNAKPLSIEPDGSERQDENQLLRLGFAQMVPLGGQGVLQSFSKVTIEDLTDLSSLPLSQSGPGEFSWDKKIHISWLDISFDGPSMVDYILMKHEKESAELFQKEEKKRWASFQKTEFIGAQACAGCHQKAFESWSQSQHKHAYTTLKNIEKHHDGECVSCHVTGFEQGGFVSAKKTPHLLGVQCENCHGPGREHILNKKKMVKNVNCESCHYGQHSPSFKREIYWSRIAHGFDA